MGPLGPLLRWGATVAAVDLPTPAIWERVLADRARSRRAGCSCPVAPGTEDAGVDLLAEVPEAADWLAGLDGRLVVGNYLYADGGTHVRVSLAADALASRVTAARPDTALAFLATPTDVFAVPARRWRRTGRTPRAPDSEGARRPLRWVQAVGCCTASTWPGPTRASPTASCPSRDRTTRWPSGSSGGGRPSPDGTGAGLVERRAVDPDPIGGQEPRAGGGVRRRAPVRRRGVRAGDVERLMAALLVHDLSTERPTHAHPWQDEAYAAVHGGIWRAPYEPRSALGLAALLGLGNARG